ncbi:MAG: DUF3298 domain-containing protein [Clostridiaceae bacterium]|nr:DUF3298 domain-containing protein [Clostridiaceae bacterium]
MLDYDGTQTEVLTGELTGKADISNGATLEYSLSYPVVSKSRSISFFYRSNALKYQSLINSRYVNELRRLPPGWGPLESKINGTFEVMYNKNGLLSIFMDTYEDMGMYRLTLGRTSATWNVRSSRRSELNQLFKNQQMLNNIVSKHIFKEVEESQNAYPGSYYFDKRLFKRPWGYYLTDRGLAVYYQKGTVAPGNSGIPTFLIPWDALKPIVNFTP